MTEDYQKALEALLSWHLTRASEYKKGSMMSMAESTWGEAIHQGSAQYIRSLLKEKR